MSLLEQPTSIKFCILLEKSPSEMLEMLKKLYVKNAMTKRLYMSVHKHFANSQNIKDDHRTASLDKCQGKAMLEMFFESENVIHNELISEDQTVYKNLYWKILKRLLDTIRLKLFVK